MEMLRTSILQALSLESNLVLLVFLVIMTLIVLDGASMLLAKRKKESGMEGSVHQEPLGIDGVKRLPARDYISDIQGIAGRPDAVIIEKGHFIPVERKALSKKIRDRHVVQLLVYMRLIEEFEGKRPPYGYLVLGDSARRVKIANTPERQAWLTQILDEMRDILNKRSEAVAKPHPKKCPRCRLEPQCPVSAAGPERSEKKTVETSAESTPA